MKPQNPLQLGQHFLKDEVYLKQIADAADLQSYDVVLEAGFGQGNLTRKLAAKSHVIAVEIDPSFSLKLPNVQIKYGNILEIIGDEDFSKFVSNIPYHISEPLLKKLLPKKECMMIVFLVPESFSEHLYSNEPLGIMTKSMFDIEAITDVPAEAFYPAPDTKSVALKLIRKPEGSQTPIEKLISSLVLQHDKKIKNALEKFYEGSLTKKQVKDKIATLEEIKEKSIYALSKEQFSKLLEVLSAL